MLEVLIDFRINDLVPCYLQRCKRFKILIRVFLLDFYYL